MSINKDTQFFPLCFLTWGMLGIVAGLVKAAISSDIGLLIVLVIGFPMIIASAVVDMVRGLPRGVD